MFDKDKLKTELAVLYQRQEFRNISDAVKLLQFLLSENLQASFSEVVELLRIAVTMSMTTSEPERCFSCLKRVKSYLRNTMREVTALAMFSIVKIMSATRFFGHIQPVSWNLNNTATGQGGELPMDHLNADEDGQ
ncbi:hypothetical protein ANN_23902 [Periplaneta americana]|uniref:HAT C-terminal dimerisation domain-containing protein n=1 Tax=Periplaneta americana TaxID=6978 RepID=A0ABQ8S1W2_PERAM|nr:hypothetical protein ANN_23902 [Periplaneta americana]